MPRTSIRVSCSAAVASQRASAEFVVPKSMPTIYSAAKENLLFKTASVQQLLDQPLGKLDLGGRNHHPPDALQQWGQIHFLHAPTFVS